MDYNYQAGRSGIFVLVVRKDREEGIMQEQQTSLGAKPISDKECEHIVGGTGDAATSDQAEAGKPKDKSGLGEDTLTDASDS